MKNCPYCAEQIQDDAIFCRLCGHYLKDTEHSQVKTSPRNSSFPQTSSKPSKSGRIIWRILAIGSALLLTGIGLFGLAALYGIEAAILGFFFFPAVFVFYPFVYWYYTGVFPVMYFALWAFSLFAASKSDFGDE